MAKVREPGTPTLDQLRLFMAVVDHGSFGAAARALNRAVSVVSYGIANLEAQLGLRLFDRQGTRKPQLTAAGKAADNVLFTFGPDSVILAGSSALSARTVLLIQASSTLARPRPPCTLCPMMSMISSRVVGRPAFTQFFQVFSVFNRFVSTLHCGLRAASVAAKRGASAPNTCSIAFALL